ncbi:C-type lectin domain family 14 member A [Hoplias malabaricus]|uniref:C-type lectin domain family 14 member A n=1 Tax=Hoplias malabaricus TaxID=27720 RepID=UPI003463256C
MDYHTGFFFLNFLNIVFSISDSSYTVHLNNLSFEDAVTYCKSTESFLTYMDNHEEISKMMNAVADKETQGVTSFWIGLRKDSSACVDSTYPLRGFSWIEKASNEFKNFTWKNEPEKTCTFVLCGLLSVVFRGSEVESWQLDSESCKKKHPFICRRNIQSEERNCPKANIHESDVTMQGLDNPDTLQVICKDKSNFTLICSKSTKQWMLKGNKNASISHLCQNCKKGYKKNALQLCVDVNECEMSHNCTHNCKNTEGSYVCQCPGGKTEGPENCKETEIQPTVEASNSDLPDTTSQPHSTTESSAHTVGKTEDPLNIIVPLIIALLIFVVLVVIIAGIIKCCLNRRARKQAKAEASKESMALNGSDSVL